MSRQRQLFPPQKKTQQKPSLSRRADRYTEDNQAAAEIILADVAGNGGEGAGVVQWARLVAARRGRA